MSAIDYKTEAKKVLDTLPDDKARTAFHLLEYLKGLDVRTELGVVHNWIKCFTDREREELLEELLESIEIASSDGDWSRIQEVIGSWEETAEILSYKQLMADIIKAKEEIERGEIISWAEVKKSLNLG